MLLSNTERRDFQRMAIETAAQIMRGNETFSGICKDLSSTGMSLQLKDESLQAGDEIEIQLGTEDHRFPPFTAQAKVLRMKENKAGDCIYALSFLKIK